MSRSLEEIKQRFANNEEVCRRVIGIFSLMSNKTRFRILCMLAEGDFCVNEIVDTIQMGKVSNISQQLRILTLAGVLEKRREKQHIIYRLSEPKLAMLIKYLETEFAEETV
ncbi:MAG: winged helix-turn-helix transcriptional regulator [Verrucomicrobia bacterium]|jgi:ArsR family transcriptional regulator, lead/cadmium/zinc/bismuth-responsive transcriptional repressor|nr:winged helix-turn-helix transcriptional regulator [Verrucomicrobiota bacterium]MBT7068522.1 winged helix-turn-helix transcriptional regulator [Verrucomicrobiota bacterium]MBT7701928.1 winged helix-turn-helix transcriptional regulator [Verrucomicrobiota bacterium]